ncbi:hypothetical protein G4Z16_01185 [Streptomyces bathyalis]|uniref:Polyketide cyclase n=1 Tax=Streptomyces bathyalis TaxID=2710756 RepID=A0A7T1WPS8_9ACTN|nr:hypothetical protein [Streptomyces bathyalis]QPP05228.1 hypothetical protein G4Z16_01185 [Streptomyces bathyalis]
MRTTPEAFTHYLAAWNEPDPDRIRGHLDVAVGEHVAFVDPANTAMCPDRLEALIREAHEGLPAAEYVRTSGIDGHNGRYRYRWEVRIDGETVAAGMDFTTVDASGRLQRIDGFFGDFPDREGE